MALYALALILLFGIPFLLYCLWNFGGELKPRKTRSEMFSRLPDWGSVQAMSMPRVNPQNASLTPATETGYQDRDCTAPARVC